MAKNSPNLPGSSRMQMPSTTGGNKRLSINQNSKGATNKVISGAKSGGIKMKKNC
jgi:hypothetical protein